MAEVRRVALVTGSATGIGAAAAIALARAGYDVAVYAGCKRAAWYSPNKVNQASGYPERYLDKQLVLRKVGYLERLGLRRRLHRLCVTFYLKNSRSSEPWAPGRV